MTITPIGDVGFDDAATLAMGEAFDRACESMLNFGSAVPAIIADLIIAAAKNGECDPGRLYEQVLNDYGIDDRRSWLLAWAAIPPPSLRFGHASSVILESPVNPLSRALASAALARILGLLILKRRLILKLFGARRVGYEFSKQLNLKRRVQNCGRYR